MKTPENPASLAVVRDASLEAFCKSLVLWNTATFQEQSTAEASLGKFWEEVEEFFENPSLEEGADIVITMLTWMEQSSGRAAAEVRKKHWINQNRSFRRDRDGVIRRDRSNG